MQRVHSSAFVSSAAHSGRSKPGPPPLSAAQALEVVIAWGDHTILHVAHLAPPRSFYLGEPAAAHEPASDFTLDVSALGVSRLPLILEDADGVSVVLPSGAELEAEVAGVVMRLPDLEARSLLAPAPELDDARLYRLAHGARVRVEYLGLSFYLHHTDVAPAPRMPLSPRTLVKQQLWPLVSFGLHSLLLGAFYCMPPTASALSLDQLNADDRFIRYHITPPAAAAQDRPPWLSDAADGGSPGRAAQDEAGAMGDPNSPAKKQRHAQAGKSPTPVVSVPVHDTTDDLSHQGIASVIRGLLPGQLAQFDRVHADGNDAQSAIGGLFGDIGTSGGNGGLAMQGTGRGGGGHGEGTIGMGDLGTVGTLAGAGGKGLYGQGAAGGLRAHGARVPRIRPSTPDVLGSLSKETIRREIGRHLNEVRFCYEQRLVSRPDLQGRVAVRFMIGMSGAVQLSAVTSSDVGDAEVGNCIARQIKTWNFPAPEGGGAVIVNYPFVLSQAGG